MLVDAVSFIVYAVKNQTTLPLLNSMGYVTTDYTLYLVEYQQNNFLSVAYKQIS